MEILIPKYRRNPNEKISSLYYGVANGNRTMTSLVKKSPTEDRMERTRGYGPGMARGQGGQVGVLVLGGMETSLDEIEYILEEYKQRKFKPERSSKEIVNMCHMLLERRNDLVRHLRKNPSERPKTRPVTLHLPVGYRFVGTGKPGMEVLARV